MGLLRNALTATMCVAPSSETPFTSRMRFPIDSRPSFSAAPPDVSWGDTVYMHVQYAYYLQCTCTCTCIYTCTLLVHSMLCTYMYMYMHMYLYNIYFFGQFYQLGRYMYTLYTCTCTCELVYNIIHVDVHACIYKVII